LDGEQPVAMPIPTDRTAQTQRRRTQPQGGFETTIPVFEWAKTIHALDRSATVIGMQLV
jgi:hypothetical protein